jgi:hypothetical protein
MSFLAPLFLAGALAVIGPLIFHLIRRASREVTPFSSLMFLNPTPPRVTRRSRLENFWLLLLRCLAVGLLALGFARPFLRGKAPAEPAGGGPGKRIAILLDVSASMRRETLWDDARRKADELLRQATPDDEFAVLAFDRAPRTLIGFEEWRSLPVEGRIPAVAQRIASMTPGWADTRLDAALIRAAELLARSVEDRPKAGEIIVISDLQEGAKLDALQGYEWPRGLSVTLSPVTARATANASAQWLAEAEEAGNAPDVFQIRIRLINSQESKREQFQLQWSDKPSAGNPPLMVYVPAGQTRVIQAPKTSAAAGSTSLMLSGDEADFDNRLFVLPPQAARTPVLFFGQDAEDDPHASLYYLRRAFPKSPRQNVEIIAHREAAAPAAAQLQQAQLAVLGDGASEAAIAAAREMAREGKIVLAPLTSAPGMAAVARLLETPLLTASEATLKDYALLAQIDFQHPVFSLFADPRFSDFTKIHFWKYRRFDMARLPGARALARFDNGDPAIVQVPLGKGSAVIFAASWRPVDGQLALSSKFLPMLHALLDQSSNASAQKTQYFVGDEVPLPPSDSPSAVRKPDGTETAVAPGVKFTAADQPGVYSALPGNVRFVVNLAPEESRISPLPPERFASLGVPLKKAGAAASPESLNSQLRLQAAEMESRQKLWRWLIVAALAILAAETLLAAKVSRPSVIPAPR